MRTRGLAAIAAAGFVLCGITPAVAQPPMAPPALGLTTGQAMATFARAVFSQCLSSRLTGGMIADLPANMRGDLRPATPQESMLVKDAAVPNWISAALGGILVISEPSKDRCNVTAIQLPVEPTFQFVLQANSKFPTPLASVPVKAGYNPIAYQLEEVTGGQRYIVHLEGSNPGGPEHPLAMAQGHAFRFSILYAWVVRQPEAAKPLFH